MRPKRSYLARSVRCRLVAIGRLLAHVQSARESADEPRIPGNSNAVSWTVRCWLARTSRLLRDERAARESACEAQAPAAPSKAPARAGLGRMDSRFHGGARGAARRGRALYGGSSGLASLGRIETRHSKIAAPGVRSLGRAYTCILGRGKSLPLAPCTSGHFYSPLTWD